MSSPKSQTSEAPEVAARPRPGMPEKQGPPGNRGTVNDCLLCEKEMLLFILIYLVNTGRFFASLASFANITAYLNATWKSVLSNDKPVLVIYYKF